jgi:protoporphyrinogen oxidase
MRNLEKRNRISAKPLSPLKQHLAILGGGMAGLAAGYFARRHGFPFTIIEAADRCGGNAATVRHANFLFDTGAHRFHGHYPEITSELVQLMGGELERIQVPSQIYSLGKRIDFPLAPLNLMRKLGPLALGRAGLDFVSARLGGKSAFVDFETFAVSCYGRYLAERFLLGYSEKLWGSHPSRLVPEIAGRRLQGLNLRAFIHESFAGKRAVAGHLEGAFYYPRQGGIGTIAERLHQECGPRAVRLRAAVTRIHHRAGRIVAIEINGRERLEVEQVISSIPMSEFIASLEPLPPAAIVNAARQLRFRSLVLVALFLDRPQVTANASLYFPDPRVPFTRVYEPKNRSLAMAPAGRTSLVAEIPCFADDLLWLQSDAELLAAVREPLCRFGFLNGDEIFDTVVVRLQAAYPVLDQSSLGERQRVHEYLDGFVNLSLTGRNGLFLYTHIHDQLKRGKEIVEGFLLPPSRQRAGLV